LISEDYIFIWYGFSGIGLFGLVSDEIDLVSAEKIYSVWFSKKIYLFG